MVAGSNGRRKTAARPVVAEAREVETIEFGDQTRQAVSWPGLEQLPVERRTQSVHELKGVGAVRHIAEQQFLVLEFLDRALYIVEGKRSAGAGGQTTQTKQVVYVGLRTGGPQ